MVKKTLVRIAKGIEYTEAMQANLNAIFKQEIEIEPYEKSPNLQRSYQRRINSLQEAFLFIVKAIPPKGNVNDLKSYLEWCTHRCDIPADLPIEEYQAIISRYALFLVNAIHDYWDVSPLMNEKNPAIDLLNKAEQYVIMQKGRYDLATLSSLPSFGRDELVLQWDKQLTPTTEETVDELNVLKHSNFHGLPKWFSDLPFYQQIYFHTTGKHCQTKLQLKNDLSVLDTTWKNLKSIIDPSVLLFDIQNIAQGGKNFPHWFSDLLPHHQEVIKSISVKVNGLHQVDNYLLELHHVLQHLQEAELSDLMELKNLPYWFLVLPAYEQQFLKTAISEVDNIEEAVSFLPSRLRTLPALANFAEHNLLILSSQGEVIKSFEPRLRSSHLASRDVVKLPKTIGDLHSQRNLERICQFSGEKPLLIQTLISPFYYLDGKIPDYALDIQKQKAVALLAAKSASSIFSTNHPFNVAKFITMTQSDNPECLMLSEGAANRLLPQAVFDQLRLLEIPDIETASMIISGSIKFTCDNNQHKAFSKLITLIQNNPFPFQGYTLDQTQRLIRMAFSEAHISKTSGFNVAQLEFSDDAKGKLLRQLTELFVTHYEELLIWEEWQSVFASHCYLLNNHPDAQKFLTTTIAFCDLAQLYCDYRNLLKSAYGTATIFDYYGRELWLSSLENLLIIHLNGTSYGSCVSGKDRKALELIHTDAMLLYREKYGRWASINDDEIERSNFVNLVTALYITRHAHEHAGQNAPGADGIKTPANYLPGDIVAAICNELSDSALTIDDILATNNEVDRIDNLARQIKGNYSHCLIAASKLREESQVEVLALIKHIVEERSHWTDQKYYNLKLWRNSSPSGIGQVRKALDLPYKSSAEALATVYHEVYLRPEVSSLRTSATQELYDCIRQLSKAEEPELIVEAQKERLEKIRNGICEPSAMSAQL